MKKGLPTEKKKSARLERAVPQFRVYNSISVSQSLGRLIHRERILENINCVADVLLWLGRISITHLSVGNELWLRKHDPGDNLGAGRRGQGPPVRVVYLEVLWQK